CRANAIAPGNEIPCLSNERQKLRRPEHFHTVKMSVPVAYSLLNSSPMNYQCQHCGQLIMGKAYRVTSEESGIRRRATSKARADSPSLQAATRAPVLLAVRCAPRRIARPVNDNREIDFTFDASRPVLSRLPFAAALWSLDRRRCALNH